MELLGFLGSALGGLFGFLGEDRKARAIEEAARAQVQTSRNLVDGAIAQWAELRRAEEAKASAQRDLGYWQQDTQRTRIYYNYQAARSGQAALLLVTGAGLLGVILWRLGREAD